MYEMTRNAPEVELPRHGSPSQLILEIMKNYFDPGSLAMGMEEEIFGDIATDQYYLGIEPPLIMPEVNKASGTVAFQVKDDRFLRSYIINVNTITQGVDAKYEAEELHEACKEAIRKAIMEQWYFKGLGSISYMQNSSPPARVSDWATSTGVVQYASLPNHWVRYESIYRILFRPPNAGEVTNKFIR